MWVYSAKEECQYGGFVYQEINGIHDEEFLNRKSAFLYYIISGKGVFIIEDVEYPVSETDVIMIPPGKRFYYKGNMKQILATAPAWEESAEVVVRKVS